MNKRSFLFFAMCGVLIAAAPKASAMIFWEDIGTPWTIGYHISATPAGDSVHFTVNLNREASGALQNTAKHPPQLWFRPPYSPDYFQADHGLDAIKVFIRETPDKLKHLEFTIPRKLLVHCYLKVDSWPLRGGDFPRANLAGYYVRIAK